MDMLNQIDRNLYLEVARKQAEVWSELVRAIAGDLRRSIGGGWDLQPGIRVEEVMEDLEYGRD